jgi:competence protein ComGC
MEEVKMLLVVSFASIMILLAISNMNQQGDRDPQSARLLVLIL